MKIEAISTHERSTIIRHVALCGKWSATRKGHAVTIARFKGQNGSSQVHYSVERPNITVSDRAASVFHAIHAINRIVAGEPPRGRRPKPEAAYIPVTEPNQGNWLPYRD